MKLGTKPHFNNKVQSNSQMANSHNFFVEPVRVTLVPKSEVTVKDFDSPVRVNCSARGVPLPNITWYKDGVKMPTKITIIGDEVIGELNLERVRPSDQGDYKCVGVTSVRPDEPFSYTTKIREYTTCFIAL